MLAFGFQRISLAYEVENEVSTTTGVTVAMVIVFVSVSVVKMKTVLRIYMEQNALPLMLFLGSFKARRALSKLQIVLSLRFRAEFSAHFAMPGVHAGAGTAMAKL